MRILFVCLGNICRSPAAEGVFRAMADADWHIDGAGTSGWHLGDAPHGPMIRAASARGYGLSGLRARQFVATDFAEFDLIIAMDRQNQTDIEALRPTGNQTPVRLFLSYGEHTVQDVPDPYYTGDYAASLDLIEAASRALLAELK